MMHRAMMQIKRLSYSANFVCIPRNIKIFHDKLGPGPKDDIIALTL